MTATVRSVFVYGTLMPGESRWHALAPFVVGEPTAAVVRGRVFDTGHGWPALVAGDAEVEGFVIELRLDTRDEALRTLDAIEGVASGLFARVAVQTVDGHDCWTYTWPGPTTGMVELDRRWSGP